MNVKYKNYIFLFLLFSISTIASDTVTNIQNNLKSDISTFFAAFQSAAQGLLYSLGVIQLVLTFGFMAMRGELELGGAAAQLVKTALIVGFFSMLISSPSWFINLYNGLNNLGRDAGGIGNLADIINALKELWIGFSEIDIGLDNIGDVIVSLVLLVIVTLFILMIVGTTLTTYAFFLLSVYVGVFWLGFGSFDQTRPWAINAIANVLRNGMKYVLSMLIVALMITSLKSFNVKISGDGVDFQEWLLFIASMIIFYSMNGGIGSWVDSYFTGSGGGENSKGVQFVQSAMSSTAGAGIGAAMGMKGAADTIAAASASGESMSVGQKAGAMLGGMAGGAAKGAIHGGDSFASNWAKTADPNYSMSSNTPTPQNPSAGFCEQPKPYDLNDIKTDGDVGGGTKGSIAEPKVGGEINPNQSDKS